MLVTSRVSGEAKHLGFPCVTSEISSNSAEVFVSSKTLISIPVWLTLACLTCMPNKFFLFPSCPNPFPLYHWLPISASLSGLACGTGSISENNTMKILNVSLLPNDLSLLSRASILCFHTQLLLAWVPWTTVFFAESPSSQCRFPVRLLPLHLMGDMPTDCQVPQIQLAVCLVTSDSPTCFFLVFKSVCYKEDP